VEALSELSLFSGPREDFKKTKILSTLTKFVILRLSLMDTLKFLQSPPDSLITLFSLSFSLTPNRSSNIQDVENAENRVSNQGVRFHCSSLEPDRPPINLNERSSRVGHLVPLRLNLIHALDTT
jgi:hypothetical protein